MSYISNDMPSLIKKTTYIALEGSDAAGKETIMKKLKQKIDKDTEYFLNFGEKIVTEYQSFPMYHTKSGNMIKKILQSPDYDLVMSPEAMTALFAVNRADYFFYSKNLAVKKPDLIITDRSFFSNLAFQFARKLIKDKDADFVRFANYALDMEQSVGNPIPTQVFQLRTPIETVLKRLKERKETDKHEQSIVLQKMVLLVYSIIADNAESMFGINWTTIPTDIRTQDQIVNDIIKRMNFHRGWNYSGPPHLRPKNISQRFY